MPHERPHLIHIGYPKAGATFLKNWFEAHPQIAFAHGGFGGFQSIEAIQLHDAAGIRCYASSSEQLVASYWDANLAMRDSVSRADGLARRQEETCTTLAGLFAGAQVLLLTRGYAGMMRSSYSQYLKSGGWQYSFDELQTNVDAEYWTGYLDYARVAALYEAAFGADRVHVLPYELLRDDRPSFLRELERIAGVDPIDFDPGRVNPSLSAQERYWYPRISRHVTRVARRLPKRWGSAMYAGYVRRFTMESGLRPIIRMIDRFRRDEQEAVRPPQLNPRLQEALAGLADPLAARRWYRRYAAEYLLSPNVATSTRGEEVLERDTRHESPAGRGD